MANDLRSRAWSKGSMPVLVATAGAMVVLGFAALWFRRDYVGHLLLGYGIGLTAAWCWRRPGAPLVAPAAALVTAIAFEMAERVERDPRDVAWTLVGGAVAGAFWVRAEGGPHRHAWLVGVGCIAVATAIRYAPGPGLP